jgi:hypothetical protein
MTRSWRAGPAPGNESSSKRQQAHVDTRQLPTLRTIEEISVGCPHDLHPGRVDKLAIKNVTGKGHVVVPPDRPPLHSRVGSQADLGLTQCHVRLLHDRMGAAHLDENPGDRRVLVAGVPSHDDVADSPDSRARGIADGAANNVGDRYHPVSKCPVESELFA